MKRLSALAGLILLSCCKPPATDEYIDRGRAPVTGERDAPSIPIDSPDTENAIWAQSNEPDRLIYGNPGQPPLLAIACIDDPVNPKLKISRYADADEGAQAFIALIGNSHVARLPVDATRVGRSIIWQGEVDASEPDLEVLTGPREVTATVPGAGMLTLNPSSLTGILIDRCRFDETDLTAEETELELDPGAEEPDESEPSAQPAR